MAAQKRIAYKQDQKTMHNVFDEFTNRNIYKLMTEGYFKGVIGQITLGKESNVFQARKEDGSKVIVKIYRLESCDFNRMYDYIKYDPRFLKLKKVKGEKETSFLPGPSGNTGIFSKPGKPEFQFPRRSHSRTIYSSRNSLVMMSLRQNSKISGPKTLRHFLTKSSSI